MRNEGKTVTRCVTFKTILFGAISLQPALRTNKQTKPSFWFQKNKWKFRSIRS